MHRPRLRAKQRYTLVHPTPDRHLLRRPHSRSYPPVSLHTHSTLSVGPDSKRTAAGRRAGHPHAQRPPWPGRISRARRAGCRGAPAGVVAGGVGGFVRPRPLASACRHAVGKWCTLQVVGGTRAGDATSPRQESGPSHLPGVPVQLCPRQGDPQARASPTRQEPGQPRLQSEARASAHRARGQGEHGKRSTSDTSGRGAEARRVLPAHRTTPMPLTESTARQF